MSVLKRFTSIVQAKTNKALDKIEDPRETLDLSYEKQLEQLQQVKRGVADVATARKRIELQAQQLQATATKLQDQARQALAANREDLAREALSRRAGIASQLEGMKTQHEQLAAQEAKLVQTTQVLQARVESFRTQKETLKASYTAAQAQTKIGEAISGISESMSDTGMAMQRAQDKIAQMQARAGAVDELMASGALTDLSGSMDPLQHELDKASASGQVELELAQMKGQLAAPAPAGELGAAGAAPAADAAQPTDSADDDGVAEGELAPPVGAPADAGTSGAAAPAAAPAEAGAAPASGDLFSLGGGGL
ncbi:MAG TPA: PspA/IM30 family protein [Acidimicrobiales bacterium]|nr:PspA/IM30 family protein [Acidimicrobiales bacterium]